MSDLDFKTISQKAVRGVFSLTIRRIVLLAINFITLNIILAKILPVPTLGIFVIANSILAFFSFFSDIGLAGAIIQKKDNITQDDLKTTFTIQEILTVFIVAVVFIFAPFFASRYNLDLSSVWLIRALAFGFFMTSLKVIPSVILERHLNFNKLVWVEIIETLVFNGMLIWLTFGGFGIEAFTYSVIARSIIGFVVIYILSPWKIGFGFSKSSAKSLLNFGLPYQLNSLLALLKDRLVPLVIAGIVGSLGIGYISQGQRLAFLSLEVMNIITRVTFPVFSRLQDNTEGLKDTLEKSLFAMGLFLYPLLFGTLAISPVLIKYLGEAKWSPVLPLVYLFGVTAFWATLSSPFTNFLNATGKIRITLKLMIMWTALEWALTPLVVLKFGFIGMGYSSALISFTSIIPIFIIKKIIKVEIIGNIWQPIFASVLMAITVFYLSTLFPERLIFILITIMLGCLLYFVIIYLIAKEKIKTNLKELLNAFFNR